MTVSLVNIVTAAKKEDPVVATIAEAGEPKCIRLHLSSKLHEIHPAAFDGFVGSTRPAVRDEQISGTIVVT
jgi:hypothetical protein